MRNSHVREQLGVTLPKLRLLDLLRESMLAVTRHPGRSLLTAIGTVVGAAAFVCTLGISSTLSQQVSTSFDIRRATEVVIEPDDPKIDPQWTSPAALDRLRQLNGVSTAGRRIALAEKPAQRTAIVDEPARGVRVVGVDAQGLQVIAPKLSKGRIFADYHDQHATQVVLLPLPIAEQLGVTRIGSAIILAGEPYTVIGLFTDTERRPDSLLSAIIPYRTAERLAADSPTPEPPKRDVIVATAAGAAQIVGRQAPLALRPEGPDALHAIAPPDPRSLRQEIEADIARTTLLLSAIALVMGAIAIGNAATAGIAARVPEIGLRRAIGGRPPHIFIQLVSETTMLGACGGLFGASLGIVFTAAISLWNQWTPVLDLNAALLASAASAGAGLLAGLWPAARAMRIEPVEALQR